MITNQRLESDKPGGAEREDKTFFHSKIRIIVETGEICVSLICTLSWWAIKIISTFKGHEYSKEMSGK